MPSLINEEAAEIAKAEVPIDQNGKTFAFDSNGKEILHSTSISTSSNSIPEREDFTSEDLHTLRRVSGKITWIAFTIAFVELCERFSYYGTTVVFVNFIQQPLPEGSSTGAGFDGQSGALGMGQRASTGLNTFNQFWAYIMPLAGAYVADAHLGRYKTIHVAIVVAIVGHVVLTVSAAPSVIAQPNASIGVFSLGLIIFGIGTGFFKSNISPLLAEQQVSFPCNFTTYSYFKTVRMSLIQFVD